MPTLHIFALLGALTAIPLLAFADPPPAAGAKSMLKIVTSLEKAGYGPFTDVSFDDGHWEVEVYKNGVEYELRVDPASGKVIAEDRDDDNDAHPTADMKPLSAILQSLQSAGFNPIREVSFERRHWEIEATQNGAKRELHVDPMTAKVTANRADN